MKILFFILLLISNFASAESAWVNARKNPMQALGFSQAKELVPVTEQVSCEHLEFRYSQIMSLFSDLSWLMEKDVFENTKERRDAHDYIQKRLGVDARSVSGRDIYEFEFEVSPSFFDDEGANSIAFISNSSFELFEPNEYTGRKVNINKEENNQNYKVKVKANTIDICLNGYVEILQLKDCPTPLAEDQQACQESGICASPITHDWQSCGQVQVIRMNFSQIKKQLGRRTKKIAMEYTL